MSQYDYDWGPTGPLAPLQARSVSPDVPYEICPPFGWVNLVLELDEDLAELIPDYTISQVKEKFGALRFYVAKYGASRYEQAVAEARNTIIRAEEASENICQVCGDLGSKRRDRMWWATLCDDHA